MTAQEIENLASEICADPDTIPQRVKPLSEKDRAALVQHLKDKADHYWGVDPNVSLQIALCIQRVGEACAAPQVIALGMMARGDAFNHLGKTQEAWAALHEAGEYFREQGDEHGWARTWIGRLTLSVEVNRVEEALENAERAHEIFIQANDYERLTRLVMHLGVLDDLRTNYQNAIVHYTRAMAIVDTHPEVMPSHRGKLLLNSGFSQFMMGELDQARASYEAARAIFTSLDMPRDVAISRLNTASINLLQGNYLVAYRDLLEIDNPSWPVEANLARIGVICCLMIFGDHVEVLNQSHILLTDLKRQGLYYEVGLTLLRVADAQIGLRKLLDANSTLEEALEIFSQIGAKELIATVLLSKSQTALTQGDLLEARRLFTEAITNAPTADALHMPFLTLPAQIALAEGSVESAAQEAQIALQRAESAGNPAARYALHLMFAKLAEHRGEPEEAIRHYQAAMAIIEQLQQGLGINTRPLFLESHDMPYHALIRLYLDQGERGHEAAFSTLEQLKSQVLAQQLSNHEHDQNGQDSQIQTLVEALNQLRGQYNALIQTTQGRVSLTDALYMRYPLSLDVASELTTLEHRMRRLNSQLESLGYGRAENVTPPSSTRISETLPPQTVVLTYYNDGQSLTAFVIDQTGLHVERLTSDITAIAPLLDEVQRWIAVAVATRPDRTQAKWLVRTQQALHDLYALLIAPLEGYLKDIRRIIFVPYGVLHGLPFQLLYDGGRYLIERAEVVISPTASLIAYAGPHRQSGVLALANSHDGKLPHTITETNMLIDRYGGDVYHDKDAQPSRLRAAPRQVLHIAAHGKHDPAAPQLSHLQLADSVLYSDELLQYDLSYELVTLSACETGRCYASGGDELIGIGRGFLYAGAGALVTSLWRVHDETTARLMERFYARLYEGDSKASALQGAQLDLLEAIPGLHPAFWGAFQLIGDASPLTRA